MAIRRRLAGTLSLVLVPVGVAYGVLIWQTQRLPLSVVLMAGLGTAVTAGGVYASTRWLSVRARKAGRDSVLLHSVLAVLFTIAWAALLTGFVGLGNPRAVEWYFNNALGWQVLIGLLVYGILAGVAYIDRTTRELQEREAAALRAELHALRAQINPHFVFNTLHSIIALVRTDPAAVEGALERFGRLLRYALNTKATTDDVALEDELEFVRGYLDLERLRFGGRLQVIEQVPEDLLDQALPALTLQPLVENALQHGIAPSRKGGTIRIRAESNASFVSIEVMDDGNGAGVGRNGAGETGLGLTLVRQRLRARFGERATLTTVKGDGNGFVARILIPVDGYQRR